MSEQTTPAAIEEFDNFLCRECDHVAHRHAMYVGPCADCWVEAKTICRAFKAKAEDEAAIDALIARIERVEPIRKSQSNAMVTSAKTPLRWGSRRYRDGAMTNATSAASFAGTDGCPVRIGTTAENARRQWN